MLLKLHSFPTRRSSDLASVLSGSCLRPIPMELTSTEALEAVDAFFASWSLSEKTRGVPRTGLNEGHGLHAGDIEADRKSTRLNSSHVKISYAVFCLKKK